MTKKLGLKAAWPFDSKTIGLFRLYNHKTLEDHTNTRFPLLPVEENGKYFAAFDDSTEFKQRGKVY